MGWVREMKLVGNLLYGKVRECQQYLGLAQETVVYLLLWAPVGHLACNRSQISPCYAELFSIESDIVPLFDILIEEFPEIVVDCLRPADFQRLAGFGRRPENLVIDIEHHAPQDVGCHDSPVLVDLVIADIPEDVEIRESDLLGVAAVPVHGIASYMSEKIRGNLPQSLGHHLIRTTENGHLQILVTVSEPDFGVGKDDNFTGRGYVENGGIEIESAMSFAAKEYSPSFDQECVLHAQLAPGVLQDEAVVTFEDGVGYSFHIKNTRHKVEDVKLAKTCQISA